MSKKTRNIILISICSLILLTCTFLFFYFYKDIHAFLNNEEYINKIKEYIESLGIFGFAVMIIMIVVQIVIAFIPGEPFELVAGIMYGTFGGLCCVLVASLIGSSIVFLLVRKFGRRITDKFFSEEKLSKYKFLNSDHNRNKLLFLIFLLPGTPKDLLTYFAPLTPIKFKDYLFITTIAKIPSISSAFDV